MKYNTFANAHSLPSYEFHSNRSYLFWLIDYFHIDGKDLKKLIKLAEDISESYHDPEFMYD